MGREAAGLIPVIDLAWMRWRRAEAWRLTAWRGAASAMATLALVACGAGDLRPAAVTRAGSPTSVAATSTVAPAEPPAPASVLKRAELWFDADGASPPPLVDVMVNGQPTRMLVDTGASHHVLAQWVAEMVGSSREADAAGTDQVGKSVALSRLDDARVVVSGWGAIDTSEMFVAALPQSLRDEGIGGILSPQRLADGDRAVVLDFRKRTMTSASLGDALHALDSEPGVALSGEVHGCGTSGALPLVRATIAGVQVDAQLDSGASNTTVRAKSEAGVRLLPHAKRSTTAVAASGVFSAPSLDDTPVKVGALEIDTTVDLVPREPRINCPNDASLGMDILHRCVLVLGSKAFAAKCTVPQ